MIIYLITNKINGKKYVGQTTTSLKNRWAAHISKRSTCRILKQAIQKYNKDNFEIKVLARCNTIEEMNHRESYYIKLLNSLNPNGYNLTTGGGNHKVSEETKAKMSANQKGIKKPKSAEHARKIGLAKLGTKQSKEEKIKRSKSLERPIEIPELGIVFKSFKETWKSLEAYPNALVLVLNGKKKSWNGLTFRHVEKSAVCEPSKKSLSLLKTFIASRPRGNNRKKRTAEMKDAMRLLKQKPILVCEIDKKFDSIKIAAKELKISTSRIHAFFRGDIPNVKGFTFKRIT